VAGVGAKAREHRRVGELLEAVLGAVVGVEEQLGELTGGEHPVLEEQADDRAVAVGEAAGKAGQPLGQAARPLLPRPLTRSGARMLTRRVDAGVRFGSPPLGVWGADGCGDGGADVRVGRW
jgi:hypothetical protein